jgi:hypothetical protein
MCRRLAARVVGDDGEAVRGEPLGDRSADAAGSARDDGRFPGLHIHRFIPWTPAAPPLNAFFF